MKRIFAIGYAALLFASVSYAQDSTPAPPPVEPEVPGQQPGASRSTPPAQAVVPVPVPIAPLKFGGIPALESTVSAYGYPIGGERMSVTTGIVSRVDFRLYTHSSVDQHLAIQISAQINPGNSGGPVMQDTKVVGVAFQGYSGDEIGRAHV